LAKICDSRVLERFCNGLGAITGYNGDKLIEIGKHNIAA
jgi:hypothetical protein